ncbi:hypothetical protein ILUMI_13868 [Ignelater luminosus]|uniref:Geranylgeranyl pyrophosphate synthase n=1 Tax=Ignelater luminosus TaxID=2038154 RepID=A0A8K0CRK4_IGNLU|nr:hypothetical protein ILUMI_13868 [Ignelater luminosus]
MFLQIPLEMINYFINTCACFAMPKKFMNTINYWLEIPEDQIKKDWERYEVSTAGFLMTQDIVEGKKLRRGKPTVHEVYGIPSAMNALYYSLTCSFTATEFTGKETMCRFLVRYGLNTDLHIELADRSICPTEELYYQICRDRGLLMFFLNHVLITQEICGNELDLINLVNKVGTYLTIVDECRRVAVNNTEDIQAVHFSYPIMYTINNDKDKGQLLLRLMQERPTEKSVLEYALSIVKSSGTLEHAKKQLYLLKREILEEYYKLPKNPFMEGFISDYIDPSVEFEEITWELS